MNHGIAGAGAGRPLGGQAHILLQHAAEGKDVAVLIPPAGEGIAGLFRHARIDGFLRGQIEPGLKISAAHGIENQIMPLLHLGPEGDVRAAQGHMSFLNGLR